MNGFRRVVAHGIAAAMLVLCMEGPVATQQITVLDLGTLGGLESVGMSDLPGHFMVFAKLHKGVLTDEK